MAATSTQEARWYDALLRENCLEIMDLLDSKPELLLEGWKEDPHRPVSRGGRSAFWKGRTALHVGARRGCPALVKKVIHLMTMPEGKTPGYSLGNLLVSKDSKYKLDAMGMAVVNGNVDIIVMLATASVNCETNPYETPLDWCSPGEITTNTEMLDQLREKTRESYRGDELKAEYDGHEDFNFLPLDEYLFHFTFSRRALAVKSVDIVRKKIFGSCEGPLRKFLLALQDGQGRTAFHVAVDEGITSVHRFRDVIGSEADEDLRRLFINPRDALGRTPLHRAASKDDTFVICELINHPMTDLNLKFFMPTFRGKDSKKKNVDRPSNPVKFDIDVNKVSQKNGFKGCVRWDKPDDEICTALHIAIIHGKEGCVDNLLDNVYEGEQSLKLSIPFTRFLEYGGSTKCYELDPLQLAALVGNASIVNHLLTPSSARDPGVPPKRCGSLPPLQMCSVSTQIVCTAESPWPPFHLAAATGSFNSMKALLDRRSTDPMADDYFQNSALHHAVKGKGVEFHTHLLDYVSCAHIAEQRSEWKVMQSEEKQRTSWAYLEKEDEPLTRAKRMEEQEKLSHVKRWMERARCVDLLLKAGLEVWKRNEEEQTPTPDPGASPEFLSWWYEKEAGEISTAQTTLHNASNAISVTAGLVATASFVGPLQPPLNYTTDIGMQVDISTVRIFAVCVTLSFYLAVAAVVLAMIPSLPIAQESTMDELQHTRKIVSLALGLLFPAIISVIIAFAAASIAVIRSNEFWNHSGLTMTTAAIGGLICIMAITMFSVRLVRIIFYRNTFIRKLYKITSFK